MVAKPQSKTKPQAFSERGYELIRTLLPWTPENCRMIAQAFIDDEGDVPYEVVFQLTFERDDAEVTATENAINDVRKKHFDALGLPVPKYEPTMLR